MKKKILSLVLALAMVLSFFPGMTMTASAAGEAVQWVFTNSDTYSGDYTDSSNDFSAAFMACYGEKPDGKSDPTDKCHSGEYLHIKVNADVTSASFSIKDGWSTGLAGIIIDLDGNTLTTNSQGLTFDCNLTIKNGSFDSTSGPLAVCSFAPETHKAALNFVNMETVSYRYVGAGFDGFSGSGSANSIYPYGSISIEAKNIIGTNLGSLKATEVTIKGPDEGVGTVNISSSFDAAFGAPQNNYYYEEDGDQVWLESDEFPIPVSYTLENLVGTIASNSLFNWIDGRTTITVTTPDGYTVKLSENRDGSGAVDAVRDGDGVVSNYSAHKYLAIQPPVTSATFDYCDGTAPEEVEAVAGVITAPTTPRQFTGHSETGYVFDGWYTKPNGQGTPVAASDGTLLEGQGFEIDNTYYGNWTKNGVTVYSGGLDFTSTDDNTKPDATGAGYTWENNTLTITNLFVDSANYFGVKLPAGATVKFSGANNKIYSGNNAFVKPGSYQYNYALGGHNGDNPVVVKFNAVTADSVLEAVGGNLTTSVTTKSYGIYAQQQDSYLQQGKVIGRGGSITSNAWAYSYGIYNIWVSDDGAAEGYGGVGNDSYGVGTCVLQGGGSVYGTGKKGGISIAAYRLAAPGLKYSTEADVAKDALTQVHSYSGNSNMTGGLAHKTAYLFYAPTLSVGGTNSTTYSTAENNVSFTATASVWKDKSGAEKAVTDASYQLFKVNGQTRTPVEGKTGDVTFNGMTATVTVDLQDLSAGNYVLVVTAADPRNAEGETATVSGEKAFTITPKKITPPAERPSYYFTYTGSEMTHSFETAPNGWAYVGGSAPKLTDVGSVDFEIELTDPINTTWSDGTTEDREYTFAVVQETYAEVTISTSGSIVYLKNAEAAIEVAADGETPLFPSKPGDVVLEIEEAEYKDLFDAAYTDGKLVIKVKENLSEDSYTFTVHVESKNYREYDIRVTLSVVFKSVIVGSQNGQLTYNTPNTVTYSVTNVALTGNTVGFEWADDVPETVKEAVTASWDSTTIAEGGNTLTIDVTGVVPAGSYGFKVITEENGTVYESEGALIIDKADQDAPDADKLTIKDETVVNKKDGSISGVTDKMEYSADGNTWTPVTGTKVENLAPGVYKVRYMEDANHNASDAVDVTIAVGEETLTVKFDLKGGTTVAPIEDVTGLAYNADINEPEEPTREGYVFDGWYQTKDGKGKWDFNNSTVSDNMTLYAKWTQELGSVTVTVKDSNGAAVTDANVVKLVKNGTEKSYNTKTDNVYSFNALPAGTYNVVVTKGTETVTALVTVSENDAAVTIIMPEGDKTSTVDNTNAGDFDAMVGDLDKIANDYQLDQPTDKVEIKLTVTDEAHASIPDAEKTAIADKAKEEVAEGKTLEFVDLKLTKKVNSETPVNIGGNNTQLLTIIIPFDTFNKSKIAVYRFHDEDGDDNDVQVLTTTPVNGEYIVVGTDTITIYAKKFSTYAIGYTEGATTPPATGTPGFPIGGLSSNYNITAPEVENGEVILSSKNAVAGNKVTITVTPDEGYELHTLTVTDNKGNAVVLTNVGGGKYTFVMPQSNVTISATFVKKDTGCNKGISCPIWPYTDAKTTAWYHDGVHYCIDNGLMNGVSTTLFAPNGTTTRAQIVTILWRLEGQPYANYAMGFTDVAAGTWYTEAVRWAASENIVGGYSATSFGPNDAITREQFAAILWRYCQYKGIDVSVGEETNILSYSDAFDIHSWAMPAMQWACGAGVIGGIADGNSMMLDPTGTATRAQAATMLQRFCVEVMNP